MPSTLKSLLGRRSGADVVGLDIQPGFIAAVKARSNGAILAEPEVVDLSAFALIRSLYRPGADAPARVLYLNVDGLTNLAIADGPVCSFTRVVGGGLEGMAAELAERRGIPVTTARELIRAFDLD